MLTMFLTIMQARTSSQRLPGKALLPVNDLPMAILAATRALNSFSDLVVATSLDKSDDLLCKYLDSKNIQYHRGSLKNVLSRFLEIAETFNLQPKDTVIRLTADNPIVDKHLLEEMKDVWVSNNYEYMTAQPDGPPSTKWPRGLSAEFFRYEQLLKTAKNQNDPSIQEHVSIEIKKTSKKLIYGKNRNIESIASSCTVDTFEDYLNILDLFENHSINQKYSTILSNM